MKLRPTFLFPLIALLTGLPASADLLSLTQSGTDWTVSVTRPAGVNEIGGFDVDLAFAPTLTYNSTFFGGLLGTPAFDAIADAGTVSGNTIQQIMEVSLLDVAVLQGLQPVTFNLFTVRFNETGSAGDVTITRADVSDGFGDPVGAATVPEPSSWMLLITVAAGLGTALRRRFA